MFTALLVIDVLVCIGLIGLILLQHGKGADVGAAFGSGASQTVFGSQGSGSFLTRSTAILAVVFFVISLALAYLSGQRHEASSVVDTLVPPQGAPSVPRAPQPVTPQPAPRADVPALPAQNAAPGADSVPQDANKKPADVPAP